MSPNKLILFIVLMLTTAYAHSFNGQDSSRIVLLGKDTFALVPIQSIKAANAVKAMNDEEIKLFNEVKAQVKDYKLQRDTLRSQKNGLKFALDNRERSLKICQDSLTMVENNFTTVSKKYTNSIKVTYALMLVAIIETIIIILK